MRGLFALSLSMALAGMAGATEISGHDLTTLPVVDVVFLGELHGTPEHHANQASAVASIAPRGLVFEMLTEAQAALITSENRADATELAAILDWDATGWPDFALYHPILTAAPAAMVFGAGLTRDATPAALERGGEALFGPDAADFGLTSPLPPVEQSARQSLQASAHCNALPADLLPGMVEVQRLRDAMLARAARDAVRATGGPVVVITGSGHARTDWGAPAALRLAAPSLSLLSVGQFTVPPEMDPPFDLWIVAGAPPASDPCAQFVAP